MKFLFIGLGGIGQRHLRNLRSLLGDSAEVHAFRVRRLTQTLNSQLEIEPGTSLETKYDVIVHDQLEKALAQRPDAVFICNPSSLHIPIALEAANAGAHLFIEKPLSHNLEGIERLCRTVKERGLTGLVGYQLRFHPCVRLLHEQVCKGSIGRPLAARVDVGEYLPYWHRYEDYRQMYAARADLGGGVILSQIHEMDYLYWLFGLPRRIFTLGGHLSSLEIDVEDVASSLLEFEVNGRLLPVQLHQDYVQRPPSRGCEVIGDEGKIRMSLSALTFDRYDSNGGLAEHHSFESFQRNELFLDELKHFLDCVQGKATPLVSLGDGAQSLRMALAAKHSLETGEIVKLDHINEC